MCRLSWDLWASTSWNPQGLSRPVMGLLFFYITTINITIADPRVRAVKGVCLQWLASWDCRFISCLGRDMSLMVLVCCQVEVSATSWSFVQRSPTESGVSECDVSECGVSECGVSECDVETSAMRRPRLS